MKYFLFLQIVLFYLFFFTRAYLLSKELNKNIKAKNTLLNTAIFFAGITSVLFIIFLLVEKSHPYYLVVYSSDILRLTGTGLITIGLVTSCIASLSLKKSWRIGIDTNEKTELITNGIYSFSRNPYFLAYDLVLIGMTVCVVSPFLIAVSATTIILFHVLILREEKYLETKHHDNYLKYRAKVRRYL